MQKLATAALLATLLPLPAQALEAYSIDPAHTYAHFGISHLGFSTLHGRFDKSSGRIALDRKAHFCSVDVSIETGSVSTGFAKRDEHLKSPDFFNAAEFPSITFKSSSARYSGDMITSIIGNLTMMGITKPVTLSVDEFRCGTNPMTRKEICGASASAHIKRSDFGIRFGLPNIGDDVMLSFEIEAIKE